MRRAQIQTLEPILIVVVLGFLIGLGLLFAVRIAGTQQRGINVELESKEALATILKLSTMPELACEASETEARTCIDLLKAEAFARMVASDVNRLAYQPVFGRSNVTLEIVDLQWGNVTTLTIYANTNSSSVQAARTYFTVHDPRTDQHRLAVMTIKREVG